jgi:DNA polymerase
MTDERRDLAEIARATRRYLERERAAGRGDLIADAVAKAQAQAPGRDMSPAPSGREPLPVRPEPSSASIIVAKQRTNLFGEAEPEPVVMEVRKEPATVAETSSALNVFDDDLNLGGLEARTTLAADALAVLNQVAAEVCACTQCGLCDTRTKAVPGVGTARSGIVFVGEAPGADEDRLGEPFVGRAGQLLDRMLSAIQLSEQDVHITNIVYWRPPGNRTPTPQETQICLPFIQRQIELVNPDVLVTLGNPSTQALLQTREGIMRTRGKWQDYDTGTRSIRAIATFHPAYLLRSPSYKRMSWQDLRAIAKALEQASSS